MKRGLILSLKIAGGVLAACLALLACLLGLAHTDFVQQRALDIARELLSKQLQSKVEIGSARVSLFGQDVSIHDVVIEDLQQRRMLEVEKLGVELDLWRLTHNEVYVKEAVLAGVRARVYKPRPDSAANYQFVIEAFKNKKTEGVKPRAEDKKARKLTLDMDRLSLQRIQVSYNDSTSGEIGSLLLKVNRQGRKIGSVRELRTAFVQHTRKGPVDTRLRVGNLEFQDQKDRILLNIDSLCLVTDNHLPRKNANRPKRGFFDAGHFDIVSKMSVSIDHIYKDSVVASVTRCQALDRGSALNVTSLTFRVAATPRAAHLSDIAVRLPNTSLRIDTAYARLPSKKQGRRLFYRTSPIKGQAVLKDISKTFAPVLRTFTIPLTLQATMSGDDDHIYFSRVAVGTRDQKLKINATGEISNLKDKHKLRVHFDIHRMTAQPGVPERVINQFATKKFMMKQLNNLGLITYQGSFDVVWKKELFRGTLSTAPGPVSFEFALDEINKYVNGKVSTTGFQLGQAMDMPGLGGIVCRANFSFDFSKPRTARMRRLKGGKLPIGHIDAEVDEIRYKGVTIRNTIAEINSDGAVAEGKGAVRGKRIDLLCTFSFTDTNEMRKTKIKPGVRLHGLSDEQKAAKAERKQKKREEKEARKQQKAAEKAAKKAEREQEKAQKAAQREQEKAQRAAEKAERKALREQQKAEKRAAKEKAKAEKRAASSVDRGI